jgi:hypothetical protein
MSKWMKRTWVSAALASCALGASFNGMAQANGETNCGLRTLNGLYVFSASGYTMPSGAALPKAIVEAIRFNGDGTLTVPAATRSINGAVARSPAGGTGNYALNADCTGALLFNGGPNFDIFVSPKGDEMWMIQTDPNNVFEGKVTRVW